MSVEELTGLELLLDQIVEVACSLYFSAGTWQLREADVSNYSCNIYMDVLYNFVGN